VGFKLNLPFGTWLNKVQVDVIGLVHRSVDRFALAFHGVIN
jgi:hypothetical protein